MEEYDDYLKEDDADEALDDVCETSVDDNIDTGTVYPEDESTLTIVEPNFEKFNEIEDEKEELSRTAFTELMILENKEDYYAQLTPVEDISDDDLPDEVNDGGDDDDLSWINVEIPSDDGLPDDVNDGGDDDDLSWINVEIPSDDGLSLIEETPDEVNKISVDDNMDTGTVYPEDESTLADVEPYYKKFNEIEDEKKKLKEETRAEFEDLETIQDDYVQLTENEELLPLNDEDDSAEEKIYTISLEDVMAEEYPPGDTLSLVDKDREDQDLIDFMIATGGDDGGADSGISVGHNVIEREYEPVVEDDGSIPVPEENKLRTDEILEMMAEEDDNENDEESEDENKMNGYFVYPNGIDRSR